VREAANVMEESWPSGVCLRGPASNRPERHWLKTVVVSIEGEGAPMGCVRYESRRRASANHHIGVVTDIPTSKPKATTTFGTSPSDILLTGWAVSGVEVARARFRRVHGTAGTRARDAKGRSQAMKSEAASTDARSGGGSPRSSVEATVIVVERRGRVVPAEPRVNSPFGRMSA